MMGPPRSLRSVPRHAGNRFSTAHCRFMARDRGVAQLSVARNGEAPHAGALRGFSLHPKVEVGAYPADKFKMRANGGAGAPGSAGKLAQN